MSHRQLKKILNAKKKSESDSDQECNAPKSNIFGELDFELLESDHDEDIIEDNSISIAPIRNTKDNSIPPQDSLEDILKECNEQEIDIKTQNSETRVLKRSLKNFDPFMETQKLFKEEKKNRKTVHKSGKKLALTPNVQYPTNIDYLLTMEKVPDPIKNIFFFDISKGYSKLQPHYIECIETNDANALNQFLHRYPFHIEGLYQMCMVFQMQGNYEQVSVLTERLLYSFQLSFHYQFSVISNNIEIDMDMNVYNKIFYKALMTHADCLGRKGCVRTALEVVKLVLALSPLNDPNGCLFLIDYYSIRSKEYKYFLEFAKAFVTEFYGHGSTLEFYNMVYSLALVKAIQSNCFEISSIDIDACMGVVEYDDCFNHNGTVVLLCAVAWNPEFAVALLKKLGNVEFKDEEVGKVPEIYAARNEDIWKPYVGWLRSAYIQRPNLEKPKSHLEGIMNRYSKLDKSEFSFDVRTVIPQEMEVGRQIQRGNLNINLHPVYLFFATFLPWNYIDS